MRLRPLALLGLAVIAACGGKIAPIDDFDDGPLVPVSRRDAGSSGGANSAPPPGPPPVTDAGPGDPPPDDSFEWTPLDFRTAGKTFSGCLGGKRFVRPSRRYGLWVGVELCSGRRYKIFLGPSRDGAFAEVVDGSGHGQDHCELVSSKFELPNDDDITSGGCTSCRIEQARSSGEGTGVYVYARGAIGEPFVLEPWPTLHYTSAWYECGVVVP